MKEQERISRRNTIEEILQIKLDTIIENIKVDGIKDTGLAQRIYGEKVNEAIRAGVQAVYQLAIDYVTTKRKTTGFISSVDLDIIKQQEEKYSIKFWRKVDMILHRNDVLMDKYHYQPRSELNSNYMVLVVATEIVTSTLALATIAKIAQLQKVKSAGLRDLFKLKDLINGLDIQKGVPRDEFKDQVKWNAILDNKVCFYCASLDGAIFDYNDPHKPVPQSEDTHYNCRCMYDYLPSILDLPIAAQLANLTRSFQTTQQDFLS